MFKHIKGTIDLAKTSLSPPNSRSIDARCHFLRELVGTEDWSVKYVRTEDQHEDILTKTIVKDSTAKHHDFLWGIQ